MSSRGLPLAAVKPLRAFFRVLAPASLYPLLTGRTVLGRYRPPAVFWYSMVLTSFVIKSEPARKRSENLAGPYYVKNRRRASL